MADEAGISSAAAAPASASSSDAPTELLAFLARLVRSFRSVSAATLAEQTDFIAANPSPRQLLQGWPVSCPSAAEVRRVIREDLAARAAEFGISAGEEDGETVFRDTHAPPPPAGWEDALLRFVVRTVARTSTRRLPRSTLLSRVYTMSTRPAEMAPYGWPYPVGTFDAQRAVVQLLPTAAGMGVETSSHGDVVYVWHGSPDAVPDLAPGFGLTSAAAAATAAAAGVAGGAGAGGAPASASASALRTGSAEGIDTAARDAAVVEYLARMIRKAKRGLAWKDIETRIRLICRKQGSKVPPGWPYPISAQAATAAASAGLHLVPGVTATADPKTGAPFYSWAGPGGVVSDLVDPAVAAAAAKRAERKASKAATAAAGGGAGGAGRGAGRGKGGAKAGSKKRGGPAGAGAGAGLAPRLGAGLPNPYGFGGAAAAAAASAVVVPALPQRRYKDLYDDHDHDHEGDHPDHGDGNDRDGSLGDGHDCHDGHEGVHGEGAGGDNDSDDDGDHHHHDEDEDEDSLRHGDDHPSRHHDDGPAAAPVAEEFAAPEGSPRLSGPGPGPVPVPGAGAGSGPGSGAPSGPDALAAAGPRAATAASAAAPPPPRKAAAAAAAVAVALPAVSAGPGLGAMTVREALVDNFFFGPRADARKSAEGLPSMRGVALADADSAHRFGEAALLGTLDHAPPSFDAEDNAILRAPAVWLNTNEPFCLAAIGVQGGGKSHTMGCILESCLVPFPNGGVVRLRRPMSALVLHFDNSDASSCEATGLVTPAPELVRHLGAGGAPCLPRDKMVILVSPSNYRARKAFYGDAFNVQPLVFRWASLTADHIKRIMNMNTSDGTIPLYMAGLMDILRRYQRRGGLPPFAVFKREVEGQFKTPSQSGPLGQRLRLLESMVAESELNMRDLGSAGAGASLDAVMAPGVLAVADMTDPLLSGSEAAGVFEVLVEQFRTIHMPGVGKLLAVDEAHKFMVGEKNDGLSNALVNVARLMRHDGIRLAVSTQSPKALAPELLELVTVAVLHRFHSGDWLSYLKSKLPLPADTADTVMNLQPGHALVFASQHRLPHAASLDAHLNGRKAFEPLGADGDGAAEGDDSGSDGGAAAGYGYAASAAAGAAARGGNVFQIHIRRRITADRGGSRINATAAPLRSASAGQGDAAPAPAAASGATGGAGAAAAGGAGAGAGARPSS